MVFIMPHVASRAISISSREETFSSGFPDMLDGRSNDSSSHEIQSNEMSVVVTETRKGGTIQEDGGNDGWINAWIVG